MKFFDRFKSGDIVFILLFSVAIVHALYLGLFSAWSVRGMAIFNTFSVACYVLVLWLYHRGYNLTVGILTTIEVTLHQMLAIYFMGFNSGFMIVYMCMFLLQFSLFSHWGIRLGLTIFGYTWMIWLIYHRDLFDTIYPQYTDLMLCINIVIVGTFMLVYGWLTTFSPTRKISELIEMLYHDQLTGLHNRKFFADKIAPKIAAAREGMVLAICDVDDFKKINDTHGHDVGDLALRLVSSALASTRMEIMRYGGEEFVIFAPANNYSEAFYLLDSARKAVAETKFQGQNLLRISVGGVFFNAPLDTERALKIADESLYRCKQSGKNRVEVQDLSENPEQNSNSTPLHSSIASSFKS